MRNNSSALERRHCTVTRSKRRTTLFFFDPGTRRRCAREKSHDPPAENPDRLTTRATFTTFVASNVHRTWSSDANLIWLCWKMSSAKVSKTRVSRTFLSLTMLQTRYWTLSTGKFARYSFCHINIRCIFKDDNYYSLKKFQVSRLKSGVENNLCSFCERQWSLKVSLKIQIIVLNATRLDTRVFRVISLVWTKNPKVLFFK